MLRKYEKENRLELIKKRNSRTLLIEKCTHEVLIGNHKSIFAAAHVVRLNLHANKFIF
jgi:hypothetical protein